MRRHLKPARAAALLLAVAVVAAACTSGESPAPATSSTTVASEATEGPTTTTLEQDTTTTSGDLKPVGGDVVLGQAKEPPTLNPFAPGGQSAIVTFIGNAYWAGVQTIDGTTLELVPDVVIELPTTANRGLVVNDDGTMTVRYDIHPDAVWEDGTPISGDDFEFTYDTIMDPDLPIAKLVYEDIIPSSVRAGAKTFEYTMTAPTVQVEFLFGVILPKHSVEGSDFISDWNDTMWVSGGPFVLSEWSPGEQLTVVRNENYWKKDPETGQQLPLLDGVTFRFIPGAEDLAAAFARREVDAINPLSDLEIIGDLEALEPEGAVVDLRGGPLWEHLNFQFGPGRLDRNETSCNENLNMRRAVAHAVDKQAIVDLLLDGRVEPLDSYVDLYSPTSSNDAWAQYRFDPGLAAELYRAAVEEAGVECSVVFTAVTNEQVRVELAELLAAMFADADIPYRQELEAIEPFWGVTVPTGTWDSGEWAWIGSPGLAGLIGLHDVWDPEAPPPLGQNVYEWGTPDSSLIDEATARYAEIRDAMNATVDEDELAALVAEAEALLADNVVFIPLYARLNPSAVWADEIAGYVHNPSQAQDTWNLEEWYRSDR